MEADRELTGYPSIDKPWLKYYSEEAINAPLPECTMYQYIWENNKNHLSDIALRYYGTKVTYGRLFDNIKKAARAFYAMGIREGDIVTIMSMPTPETIYTIYGLNYIGAVANMVYMTLSEKEILDTLNNTKSKLFMVLDPVLDKIKAINNQISIPIVVLGVSDSMSLQMKLGYKIKVRPKKQDFMTWKKFLEEGINEAPMFYEHAASAVIVYTSGTTGEPKGVVLSNDNINALAFQYICSEFNFHHGDSFLFFIPTFLGFGIGTLSIALCAGLDTTLWIELDPNKVAEEVERLKPKHIMIGVAFIDAILKQTYKDMKWSQTFGGGGGAVCLEKEREINSFLKTHGSENKFLMGYGLTELTATACSALPNAWREGSVGIPLPFVNIRIQDSNGNELTYGEIGEIYINAPNLMQCYYQNPDATNEVIHEYEGSRWIQTGDLGYLDCDGFLFIQGRIKRISYIRMNDGTVMRLFLQRIEEFIETQSYIEKCAVIVQEDKEKINIPIAFVTINDDYQDSHSLLLERLNRAIKHDLPEHNWPESIYIIGKMPLTASGKIDYRALEEIAKGNPKA